MSFDRNSIKMAGFHLVEIKPNSCYVCLGMTAPAALYRVSREAS
jgi:hypothetical protein